MVTKKITRSEIDSLKKDSVALVLRKPYIDAEESVGKESVGGIITKVELDITHPLAFGYRDKTIPV